MTGHSQTLEFAHRVSNVVELLGARAQHEPQRYAFTFLADGETEGPSGLKTGTIPKTSSGKIQRSACRTEFLDRNLETLEESA
jgi:hypothetical protein